MTAITAAPSPALDIGGVMSGAIGVLWRRFPALAALGLPLVFLPNSLAQLLPDDLWAVRLVAGFPGLVFVGGISLLTWRDLGGGERLGIGGAFAAGLRRFGTMWAIGFIGGLATTIGCIFFIVPGIIVTVGWMPAPAVAMAEGIGTSDALGRAWRLTGGQRWRIFALLLVAALVLGLALMITAVVAALVVAAAGEALGERINDFAVLPAFALVNLAITTVGAAAVYAGLARAKGAAQPDIAEVFA